MNDATMFTDLKIRWNENFATVGFSIFLAGQDDGDITLSGELNEEAIIQKVWRSSMWSLS